MAAVVLPAPRYTCPRVGQQGPGFADLFVAGPAYQRIPSPSEKIVRQKKKLKGACVLGCRYDNSRKRLRK